MAKPTMIGATIEQRPVFQETINFVREEDMFMVEAIDRLGRNSTS